ncbi:MAG: histidine phosphatase family protein [Sulfurovum sp.]|nr:histidine phosphatase family protein [Sulfurovum sp.]
MLNKFFFLRHGITNFNKAKRYTGHEDIALSSSAYEEIKNTLPLLNNRNISIIYSSPLLRARQTAHIIANYLSVPIVIVDEFKERSFGLFEGKRKLQYIKKCFPEGQTLYSYRKQVLKGLRSIKIENDSLIIAHSGTYKVLMKYYYRISPKYSVKNNELIYFDLKEKHPTAINDTEYLKSSKCNAKRLDEAIVEIENMMFNGLDSDNKYNEQ